MSHPLDEVQNTPWGRKVQDDIDLTKSKIIGLDLHVAELMRDMKENTEQTKAVKADTQWLIDVFKGAKATGPLVGWIIVTIAGIMMIVSGAIAFFHGKSS